MIENLTDFVNTSVHWLIGALVSILSWSIICVQAIAAVVYFLYIAVVRVAIAGFHWLITSLERLFNVIATFCDWLITSLGIAENGLPYILGVIIVAMIIMLSQLIGKIAYLKSENDQLKKDRHKQIEQKNREAIINGAMKLIHWFVQQ